MNNKKDPSQHHTEMVMKVRDVIEKQKKEQEAQPQAGTEKTYSFQGIHLGIGLPTYGGQMNTLCAMSLLRFSMMAAQMGLTWSLETMVNESLVQRARNSLMAKLMTDKSITHIMFIDSDIEFNPEHLIKMLMQLVVDDTKHIVGGAYPKKTLPIAYNINFEHETQIHGPLYTVDTLATGFLMFRRKVWQDLVDANPQWKYRDDIGLGAQFEPNLYSVFDCYIDESGHYLSEDWAFCRRVKAIGYKCWCDSRVELNHIGNYTFKGDANLLKIKVEDPEEVKTAKDLYNQYSPKGFKVTETKK